MVVDCEQLAQEIQTLLGEIAALEGQALTLETQLNGIYAQIVAKQLELTQKEALYEAECTESRMATPDDELLAKSRKRAKVVCEVAVLLNASQGAPVAERNECLKECIKLLKTLR